MFLYAAKVAQPFRCHRAEIDYLDPMINDAPFLVVAIIVVHCS